MKSHLTPVSFDMGRQVFNPDKDKWEIGRQVVIVYRQDYTVPVYNSIILFKMKERFQKGKKYWFVSCNPLPMLPTDNPLLQKTAKKFKYSDIKSYSVYCSKNIYR